ncbi:MAG: hypothetical protein HYY16_17140 [Planctomycetes bacterium]|nr:hypothetical protein [Planctomycetota bacterium]
MDQNGDVVAKPGGRTVEAFEAADRQARRYIDLKKKADAGDEAARKELTILSAELGQFTAQEGRARLQELTDLSPAQQKTVDALLTGYEVRAILSTVTEEKSTQLEAGGKFLEMKKAGRIPGGEEELQGFWILILDYAESEKDATSFEEALDALKAKFGRHPAAKKFLEEKTKVLERLKAEGKEK